jgi:hypothetical protein
MEAEGERKAHINIKWRMEYEVLDSLRDLWEFSLL